MDGQQFSKQEVKQKLAELGYTDVSEVYLTRFWQELHDMIDTEDFDSSSEDTTEERDSPTVPGALRAAAHPTRPLHQVNRPAASKSMTRKTAVCGHRRRRCAENNENDPSTANSSLSSDWDSSITADTSTRPSTMRRKVVRKRGDEVHIFDESFAESESAASDITVLEQRLRDLPLKETNARSNNEFFDDDGRHRVYQQSRSASSISDYPSSSHGLQYPAFIRPSTSSSDIGRVRRADPVSRYHQFKEEWKMYKVPGENCRSGLRWSVRENMMSADEIQPRRRCYLPNNYIVPTEKKRLALRWQVRSALAKK